MISNPSKQQVMRSMHLSDSNVSFCGAGMSKKKWVMKTVVLILNCFPSMVYWDISRKWWQLLVPGTISPNSCWGSRISLAATIYSLSILRGVIPSMDDLQYCLTAPNVKNWLLTGLCKLAWSILCLTVLPIPLQGDFPWLVSSMSKSYLWWQRFRKALYFLECIVQLSLKLSTNLIWGKFSLM